MQDYTKKITKYKQLQEEQQSHAIAAVHATILVHHNPTVAVDA
jgi:hypothetical protein